MCFCDSSKQRLVKEFVKILNQVNTEEVPARLKLPESFRQLVSEMKNNKYSAKEFALILKGMVRASAFIFRDLYMYVFICFSISFCIPLFSLPYDLIFSFTFLVCFSWLNFA